MHGAHLLVAPAHGLQRRVIVRQLYIAAHEVLLLIDDHETALVDLQMEREIGRKWRKALMKLSASKPSKTSPSISMVIWRFACCTRVYIWFPTCSNWFWCIDMQLLRCFCLLLRGCLSKKVHIVPRRGSALSFIVSL